jgi:transcriptional regulator with XRE-family HTH domain
VKRDQKHWETEPLGELIGRALEEEGLGVRGLARQSGVSPGQLSRILSGKTRRPSVETLARLAKALERDLAALLVAAEPDSELSGERLATARVQLLEAIDRLSPDDRDALAAERRELRRQIDEVDDLASEAGELHTRIVELQAGADFAPGSRELKRLQERLDSLTTKLEALDKEFAGAVRAAATRLFTEVRGRELAPSDQLRLTLHQAPRAAFEYRSFRDVLHASSAPQRARTPDRGLRQLMRIWEQLDAKRRRRVFEYAEDQLRLSLYETPREGRQDEQDERN